MPKLKAVIFDVDGTLADTERDGHLVACNEAFARIGFDVGWGWEEFKDLAIQLSKLEMCGIRWSGG